MNLSPVFSTSTPCASRLRSTLPCRLVPLRRVQVRQSCSGLSHLQNRTQRSTLQVVSSSNRRSPKSTNPNVTTIRFGQTELNVPSDNLWQLAIPAALFIGVSSLLGPLVVGIAFAAVAMGAAFTAGTIAFAFPLIFLLPFIFMPLIFGGFAFTGMVTFGVLSIIPKLMALAIAASGLAIGWGAVNLLRPAATSSDSAKGKVIDVEEETEEERIERELREEQRQRARELREFDDLLEGKNRKYDNWRP